MKLITSILIFALLATSASAAYVTPEKYQVTEYMQNYNLNNENNSLQLACEIGQYVSEEYGWNCDIRQLNFSKHTPVYINVFYPAADTKKGHEAYYGWFGPQKKEVTGFWGGKLMYRDWGSSKKFTCYVSGVCDYPIMKSYFGEISEENATTPVIIEDPIEEDTPHVIPPDNHVGERLIVLNGSDVENNTVIEASGNNNTVENSTNVVNNQGVIDTIKQYFFDFSNTNWSNVSFNFWG